MRHGGREDPRESHRHPHRLLLLDLLLSALDINAEINPDDDSQTD